MGGALLQEFAKQVGLLRQEISSFIPWEKVAEFIAEHSCTTGFHTHHGDIRLYVRLECVQNFEEQVFGSREHPKIVERTSAAQVTGWHQHFETSSFKNVHSGNGGFR